MLHEELWCGARGEGTLGGRRVRDPASGSTKMAPSWSSGAARGCLVDRPLRQICGVARSSGASAAHPRAATCTDPFWTGLGMRAEAPATKTNTSHHAPTCRVLNVCVCPVGNGAIALRASRPFGLCGPGLTFTPFSNLQNFGTVETLSRR